MKSLGTAPFQGTLLPNGLPGIRRVTKHQAILYLDVDEPKEMAWPCSSADRTINVTC